jgi:hypothetical protein
LYDSLVDMLHKLTLDKFNNQHLKLLGRLVVEKSIVTRLNAFEARLAEFEAAQSRECSKQLELPPPQPEGIPDGERPD